MSKQPDVTFNTKTIQVEDGKAYNWYPRKDGTFVEVSVCCDCSLVHVIEMKPNKRAMRVKVWRHDEQTNKLRKLKRSK